MYTSKSGNYIFTDQNVGDFQVVLNLRTGNYQLNAKSGVSLIPGYEGQKYYRELFGLQFKRKENVN